jgi:hypothetical protein
MAGYGPELRATLVRSVALNRPGVPQTAELLARAGSDPDAGVRLIALAGAGR